ncbi:hypothetical protein BV25DRAFT_1806882, partial [Artomyces pyxidatus]
RCFPHVINISVQTALKSLSKSAPDPLPLSDRLEHQNPHALKEDPVGKCRSVVGACRDSSMRREDFLKEIEAGNKAKVWKDGTEAVQLRVVQLLRDVETRWSSTFLMIDRALELSQAVNSFMSSRDALAGLVLTPTDYEVLSDIRNFLSIPHETQQELSFEQTPTLPHVIPSYELLVTMLRDAQVTLPRIRPAIQEAIRKIEEYMNIERQKPIYAVSISEISPVRV